MYKSYAGGAPHLARGLSATERIEATSLCAGCGLRVQVVGDFTWMHQDTEKPEATIRQTATASIARRFAVYNQALLASTARFSRTKPSRLRSGSVRSN